MSHNSVSYVKSIIRIIAGALLISGSFIGAGIALIIAELLGILEEIV